LLKRVIRWLLLAKHLTSVFMAIAYETFHDDNHAPRSNIILIFGNMIEDTLLYPKVKGLKYQKDARQCFHNSSTPIVIFNAYYSVDINYCLIFSGQ